MPDLATFFGVDLGIPDDREPVAPGQWLAPMSSEVTAPVELLCEGRMGRMRLTVYPNGEWQRQVAQSLKRLVELPANWDFQGATPVSIEAVASVIHLLNRVMLRTTIPPTLVPGRDGSLQLEWHDRGIDLEVEIKGDGTTSIGLDDPSRGIEWDGPIWKGEFPYLRDAIARLS
jgi:hypothetical protein